MTTLQELRDRTLQNRQSPSGGQEPAPEGLAEPTGAAQAAPEAPVEAPASTMGAIGNYLAQGSPPMQMLDFLMSAKRGMSTEGPTTSKDAMVASALDQASLGTVDNLVAAFSAAQKGLEEGSLEAAGNAFEESKLEANLALHRNRKDYPGASTAGDVGGSIVGGLGLGKLGLAAMAKFAPSLHNFFAATKTGNVVGTSLGAGIQAGAYRYASDGSIEQIAGDATFSTIGGMVVGGLARGGIGGWVVSKIKGNVPKAQQQVGEELYRMLLAKDTVSNAVTKGRAASDLKPQDIVRMLGEKDPDLLIADVYPGLNKRVSEVITHSIENPSRKISKLRDVLAARNNAELIYASEARRAIQEAGDGLFYTPTAYKGIVRKVHEKLRPEYDGIFQGLRAKGVRIQGRNVYDQIKRLAAEDPRIDTSASYYKEAMSTLKKALQKNTIKGRPGMGAPARRPWMVDPQSLHNIKRELGAKLGGNNNDIMRGNALIYDELTKVLQSLDPKYAELTSTYSSAASASSAYQQGQRLFTQKNISPEDVAEVTSRFSNATDGGAFINGAKYALWNKVKNTRSAEAIRRTISENENSVSMLRDIIGEDSTQELLDNIASAAMKESTDDVARATLQGAPRAQATRDTLQQATDAAIARSGGASTAARFRAASRLIGGRVPTESEIAGAMQVADEALSQPAANLPAILDKLQGLAGGSGLPQTIPTNMALTAGLGEMNLVPDEASELLGNRVLDMMGTMPSAPPEAPSLPARSLEQIRRDTLEGRD